MTTGGEGGMVTTQDADLAERMWSLRDHGKSRAAMQGQHPPGFRWVVESFGTNWRLTGPQAAIGRVQLGLMPGWTARREAVSAALAKALAAYPCIRLPDLRCQGCTGPCPTAGCQHAHYRLQAWLDPDALAPGWDRDRLIAQLNQVMHGDALHGPCPEIYLERAYQAAGFVPAERLPVAARLGNQSLLFKIYPTMTDAQVAAYTAAIHATLSDASAKPS